MAMHGRRLDALWKLSKNAALTEEDMTRALLTIAAAAIRPGHPFAANLMRVDGGRLVIEETISRGPHAAWLAPTGGSIALDASLYGAIAPVGGVRACANVAEERDLATLADATTRSFIACGFRAGDVRYVVALVSSVALAQTFDVDDAHFIESLATLLEARLQRRLQRARMFARAAS